MIGTGTATERSQAPGVAGPSGSPRCTPGPRRSPRSRRHTGGGPRSSRAGAAMVPRKGRGSGPETVEIPSEEGSGARAARVDTTSERWILCRLLAAESGAPARAGMLRFRGSLANEAHVSAEPHPPAPHPRLPGSHEDAPRTRRAQAPPGEGPQATHPGGFLEARVSRATAGLPRTRRIRQSRDYRRVGRSGSRRAGGAFVLISAPGRAGEARLGVTVSRRVGKAVVRNRVKRRIREWFRQDADARASGLDLVVIARPAAAGLAGDECARELQRLLGASR